MSSVHLCTVSPWRDALDFFSTDSEVAATARPVFGMPPTYAAGDYAIFVVDANEPAVLNVDILTVGYEEGRIATGESVGAFRWGVSIQGVEERLGEAFPAAPATLSPDFGERVICAIFAELANPRSSRLAAKCEIGSGPQVRDSWFDFDGDVCRICNRKRRKLVRHEISRAEAELGFYPGAVARMCVACHRELHSPLSRTPAELMFGHRQACPKCAAKLTHRLMWGMPADSPPPGASLAGCMLPAEEGPLPNRQCGRCNHSWRVRK